MFSSTATFVDEVIIGAVSSRLLMASRTECGVDEFPAASVAVISNWYEFFNSASGDERIETCPVF
eukprot:COSAG01_NODE_13406_length_1588_cov_3573.688591_2_plen_65_part_00